MPCDRGPNRTHRHLSLDVEPGDGSEEIWGASEPALTCEQSTKQMCQISTEELTTHLSTSVLLLT